MAVPGNPSTLTGLNATGIRKVAYNAQMQVDSVRPSVFSQIKTKFQINDVGEIVITKPGVLMDISQYGKKEMAQSVKLTLRKPLHRSPQFGTDEEPLANEDETELLYFQAYYNEIKKSVKMWQWGYDFNDTEYLNYNAGYSGLMTNFFAELDDARMQQALLLTYAEELTHTPTSLVQAFNRNWFIPNLVESSFPAYDVTPTTQTDGALDTDDFAGVASSNNYYPDRVYGGTGDDFVENIADALIAASGTGAIPNAILNVDNMAEMCKYIVDTHKVEPIMLDGIPSYLFMVPTPTKYWTMNPSNTGSWGAHMATISDYKDPKRATLIGEMGRIMEQFVCIHNPRYMTLTVGGTNGAYTLKPGILWPGNNDDRNTGAWSATSGAQNYVFDVGFVLGAQSICKFRRDDMKTDLTESTRYGKVKGVCTYLGEGIQLPIYNLDAAAQDTDTFIYRGSCVVPISRRQVNTIS